MINRLDFATRRLDYLRTTVLALGVILWRKKDPASQFIRKNRMVEFAKTALLYHASPIRDTEQKLEENLK